ncbi:MAG: hypothetical protein C5B48_09390 [Candidatus Rokuibacteriota bacterium]|nr:MAG: hypothetical protein C5B48_09390 [Candidatus Rokubacteria bacterium]
MEYRILGPLEVLENGRPIALVGTKQRALLAILLLHANEVVPRDRLIDELWHDEPPETARAALQVHVSQLRKALGRDAIETRGPGYGMWLEDGALDADRFEHLVSEARDEHASVRAELLSQALGLWRGPALADLEAALAASERARLEEQRFAALEQRIDSELELGHHTELVPELEGLVHEHPLRERLRGQLMLALYRSGRQADALETYREGRNLLDEELGLEPGEDLRALERAILEQDPAIGGPPRGFPQRLIGKPRRRRYLLGGAVLVAVGALTAVVVHLTSTSKPAPVSVAPDSVAVVDAHSNRVVADVPIGGRPIAMTVGAGALWVVDGDNNTVVRIDPKTRRVVKTIGLGVDVSDVAVGFGSVWVAGGNSDTLTRIDPRLYQGQVRDTFWAAGAGEVVARPVFFVATSAGGGLWVSRGPAVMKVDPRTGRILKRVAIPAGPAAVAVGEGNTWVPTYEAGLIRLDAETGQKTGGSASADTGRFPTVYRGSLWLIVFPGQGGPLVKGQVWRLDPATLETLDTKTVPSGYPLSLAAGEGALWTADKFTGTVWRVDPGTGTTVTLARIARIAHEPISIAAGYGAVWVGVQGSD